MNKAKLIGGLNEVISGLVTIRDALCDEAPADTTVKVPKKTTKTSGESDVPVVGTMGKFDPAQLCAMPYNEFKKLAARLGVSCKGTREDIMKRVMALDITFDENGEAVVGDVTIEKTSGETTTSASEKKLGRKTTTSNPETGGDGKKSDKPDGSKRGLVKKAVSPAPDEFDTKAKAIADDTPVEDIIAALSDVGVKATKGDYLTKLAAALREGKLEVDDEDETPAENDQNTEEDTDTEPEDDDEEEITSESYFPQFDPKGFNNPDNMTDERCEAITTKMDEILTDYSEGNLSPQNVQDYLVNKATQEELDLLGDDPSDDDMLKAYMELVKRTIDNDGEEHTEEGDPYEVGDTDMCCAHPLKQVRKTGKFVCEMCGSEFEAE